MGGKAWDETNCNGFSISSVLLAVAMERSSRKRGSGSDVTRLHRSTDTKLAY